ncbi:MAG: cache domain-containing protein [Paenacidovorax caeni]
MHLSANETTMPRLHLIGTVGLLLVVTLAMAVFYSWRNEREQRTAFARIEQVITQQQHERLTTEMQSAVSYLEFQRRRTKDVLRRGIVEQVDAAMQIVQAIHDREAAPQRPPRRCASSSPRRVARFFDGRGYFFIDDMQGRFVLLPTAPQYERRAGIDNRDDTGAYIMRTIARPTCPGHGVLPLPLVPPGHARADGRQGGLRAPLRALRLAHRHGRLPVRVEALQKREAMQRLRGLRTGASGSVGLIDSEGRSVLSPSNPNLEGLLPAQMPELEQRALQKLRDVAQTGGGFVEYEWPRPARAKVSPWAARPRWSPPPPGAGCWSRQCSTTNFHSALRAETRAHEAGNIQQRVELALMVLGALALGVAGSFGFSRWSRRLFANYGLSCGGPRKTCASPPLPSSRRGHLRDRHARRDPAREPLVHRDLGYSAEEAIGQTRR